MGKNLSQLRASVQAWYAIDAGDTDERLPVEVIDDLINWAIEDYLKRRESRFGEQSVAFQSTLYTPDYPLLTVAPNFSKPKKLWYLDDGKVTVIDWMDKDPFDVKYPYSSLLTIDGSGVLILAGGGVLQLEGGGQLQITGDIDISAALGAPLNWTLWEGNILLGPAPDSLLMFFLDYYGTTPKGGALATPTDSNLMTQQADQYVVFKALSGVSLFDIEDERVPLWEGKAAMLERAMDLEDSRQHISARGKSQSREPG